MRIISLDCDDAVENEPTLLPCFAHAAIFEPASYSDTRLPIPVQHLKQMFEFILKGNYFTFNGQCYLQQHGTSMGTPFAPNFANIFMSRIENKVLATAPAGLKPLLWIRFIDDIFLIWQHGEQSLTTFLEHINSIHDTIKFVGEHSMEEINFLDTTLYFNKKVHLRALCSLSQQTFAPYYRRNRITPLAAKGVLSTAKLFGIEG